MRAEPDVQGQMRKQRPAAEAGNAGLAHRRRHAPALSNNSQSTATSIATTGQDLGAEGFR